MIPTFLTHYSRGAPFLSVTASPADAWPGIVAGLSEANVWGVARFADPDYLRRRARVEARLRAAFEALGGRPALRAPIYAFLGRHPRWEAQERPGMRAWEVPLASLPAAAVSFTVGDSLLTWDADYRAAVGAEERPLLRLDDVIAGVLEPTTLEAQLWWRPNEALLVGRELP